jgi:hypothetical protein
MKKLLFLILAGCGLDNYPVEKQEDSALIEDAVMLGDLAISPSFISFGEVEIGQTATQEVQMINTGDTPLSVASVYVEGDSSFMLSTSILSFDIEAGMEEITEIEFTPSEDAEVAGTLNILVSSESSIGQVELSGTGSIEIEEEDTADTSDPEENLGLSIEKILYDFGLIGLNSTATITITMSNTSSEDITVTNITSSNSAFAVSDFSSVLAGETFNTNVSRALTLTFTPTDEISYAGEITIETDSDITPSLTVSLAGEGSCSDCVPQIYVFHNGSSNNALNSFQVLGGFPATETLQIQNNGTEPLVISSIDLLDDNSAPSLFCGSAGVFMLSGATSGTVAPGASQDFTVTLTKVDPNGDVSFCGIDESKNSITINSNDPSKPALVINLGGAILG